jgi:hypothetical protein
MRSGAGPGTRPVGQSPATAGRASGDAKRLKHARYVLWRRPEDLTERQAEKLAWIAKTDPRLHRAYLLKEGCGMCSRSRARPANRRWTGGSDGPTAAGSPPSSSCNATFVKRGLRLVEEILVASEAGELTPSSPALSTATQLTSVAVASSSATFGSGPQP